MLLITLVLALAQLTSGASSNARPMNSIPPLGQIPSLFESSAALAASAVEPANPALIVANNQHQLGSVPKQQPAQLEQPASSVASRTDASSQSNQAENAISKQVPPSQQSASQAQQSQVAAAGSMTAKYGNMETGE